MWICFHRLRGNHKRDGTRKWGAMASWHPGLTDWNQCPLSEAPGSCVTPSSLWVCGKKIQSTKLKRAPLLPDQESATDWVLNNSGCKTPTETPLLLLSHAHPWHFAAAIWTVCLHQRPPLYRHTTVRPNTPTIFKWAFDRSLEVFCC